MTSYERKRIINPLTTNRIPEFKDYKEAFSQIYKINIIQAVDTNREFLGLGQEYKATCYYACERSVLMNDFNISFEREYNLIKLHKSIDKYKHKMLGKTYDEDKHNIKKDGFQPRDVKNIADFFGINAFNSNKANMDELTKLVNHGINPIVFKRTTKKDDEGHFVVVYALDNDYIYYFDPAYRGERPRENIPHKGWYRKRTHEQFLEQWTNKHITGGYVFFYDKRERPPFELDGYYLT